MKAYIKYSTKIWITSVVTSPILMISWSYLFGNTGDAYGFFLFIALAIVYGFVLSVPNWLLLVLGTKYIFQTKEKDCDKRLLTQGLVLILTVGISAILFLISGDLIAWLEALFKFLIFYILTLTIGVWIYKLA